jgi:hypothetical protein
MQNDYVEDLNEKYKVKPVTQTVIIVNPDGSTTYKVITVK